MVNQSHQRSSDNPPQRLIRRITALVIFLASSTLWLATSDVAQLIAKQRHVLVGRYSEQRFTTLAILTLILWAVAWAVAFPSRLSPRQMRLRMITVGVSVLATLVVADVSWRLARSPRYVEKTIRLQRHDWPGERVDDLVRHRPANLKYQITFEDEPETARSYPRRAPGYPTVNITLSTDQRGFRNRTSRSRAQIVTLGDSYTEGSRVDDSETWPVQLEKMTGRSVYNLGISGASPSYYLNALQVYGLQLQPKIVICMLYEGNDFRGKNTRASSKRWPRPGDIFKRSPIRLALKRTMIRLLGPINASAAVPDAEPIAWLPVAVPQGPDARYYTFQVKDLTQLYPSPQQLRNSHNWQHVAATLTRLIEICREHDVRLIFTYASSKPPVVLPLAEAQVSAEQLHAFASYRLDNLPPPAQFKQQLYQRLDGQQTLLARFCAEQGVEFVSPSDDLRRAMAEGVQVYYTYDQHWTAPGHEVVAQAVNRQLTAPVQSGRLQSPP